MPRSLFALKRPCLTNVLQSDKDAIQLYSLFFSLLILKPWEFLSSTDVFILEAVSQGKFWMFVTERAFHIATSWPNHIVSVYFCAGEGILSLESENELKNFGFWKESPDFLVPIPMLYSVEKPFSMPSKLDFQNLGLGLQVMILHLQQLRTEQVMSAADFPDNKQKSNPRSTWTKTYKENGHRQSTDCQYRVVWRGERIRGNVKKIRLRKPPIQDGNGNTRNAHVYTREFVEANMRGESFAWYIPNSKLYL